MDISMIFVIWIWFVITFLQNHWYQRESYKYKTILNEMFQTERTMAHVETIKQLVGRAEIRHWI